MKTYWLEFTDGSAGCCQGESAYDAVEIAEKLTGKKVNVGEHKWAPEKSETVKGLPYPANPAIWLFDHPVHGACPTFCFSPERCAGRSSCPRDYACTE